ncbi:MAG TPA: MFS transporter, partial [Candidatus Tectomicrobia bacterium]
QQVFHFTPYHAGLILAPGAIVMGVVGVGAGRLADITEPRWPICLGFVLQAVAMYYLGLTSLTTSTAWLTTLVIVYRMSFGCVHAPLTATVLKTLPPERLSMGSGLDGIHRGFASAFGIALGSTLLERRLTAHQIRLGEQHDTLTSSVWEATSTTTDILTQAGVEQAEAAGQALTILWEQLREQAHVAAYQDTFLMLCGITLLALVPAALARRR